MKKMLVGIVICSVLLAGCGSKSPEEVTQSADNKVISVVEETEETIDNVDSEQEQLAEEANGGIDCPRIPIKKR